MKGLKQTMTIWLAVTPDRYELPITFGDNCKELAMMMRVPLSSIYQVKRKEKQSLIKGGRYRVRIVEIEEGRGMSDMDGIGSRNQWYDEKITDDDSVAAGIAAGTERRRSDMTPEDYFEKADYAMFCMHKSLKSISPALGRISRLCGLLRVGEKDGKNTLPTIITHNESRMAIKHLTMVKRDVDEAYQEILSIFEDTNTESVGQGPEPGGEGKS